MLLYSEGSATGTLSEVESLARCQMKLMCSHTRPCYVLEEVEGVLSLGQKLAVVDGLLQVAMKEGVLHLQLVDRPINRGSNAEDNPNCS